MDFSNTDAAARKPKVSQLEVIQQLEEATGQDQKPIWKLLLDHRRIFIYALFANSGALLFGYDILVQGAITALPAFSMSYGSYFGDALILPALWQGLWQAMNSLGIMMGASMNGVLQDRFGRKPMFFVGGAIAAVGGALEFISPDLSGLETRRGVLLGGKIILGVGMGILMSSCQTYVSEISSPRLRTILLGLFPLLTSVGQIMSVSVVFSRIQDFSTMAVKIPFASQWAFSGLAMVSTFLIPESPSWLVSKGRIDAAEKSLKKLHGAKSEVTPLVQVIQSTLEQERIGSLTMGAVSYSDCFKGSDLRRTRIVILLNSLQQFIGVSLLANATYFFIMAGMSPTKSLTINQIAIGTSIFVTLLSWLILAKCGRRIVILCGFAAAGVMFLTMAVAGFFQHIPSATNYIGVALMLVGLACGLSVSTAYPIVAAEIPSVRLRAKTLGIGFFFNALISWIFNFCVPYMFNADQGNLGGKIGFVFCATCMIGFALTWFEIPETKNLTNAQLNFLFQSGARTREFGKINITEETDVAEGAM
ncbi:general substrate transporter [Aspergillus granulosus]|uniref:General substrate transporter n=1 Tax=Aspergillus granulosus TaxID=176169 RepID=A0ABR4HNR2_9EURO